MLAQIIDRAHQLETKGDDDFFFMYSAPSAITQQKTNFCVKTKENLDYLSLLICRFSISFSQNAIVELWACKRFVSLSLSMTQNAVHIICFRSLCCCSLFGSYRDDRHHRQTQPAHNRLNDFVLHLKIISIRNAAHWLLLLLLLLVVVCCVLRVGCCEKWIFVRGAHLTKRFCCVPGLFSFVCAT